MSDFIKYTEMLLGIDSIGSVLPIRWEDGKLLLLDQRALPESEIWLSYSTAQDVAIAIKDMVVRGAPAIGITAAFGLALEAKRLQSRPLNHIQDKWEKACQDMSNARPTAVNLAWAVRQMRKKFFSCLDNAGEFASGLEQEAISIWREDVIANKRMGEYGAALLPDRCTALTHCNAGALATGAIGTALGVIRLARQMGKDIRVIADETRPWLQGIRLTAWELMKDDIDVTVIVDSAAACCMAKGMVDAVITGADRIAANGDVANKIGTYSVAQLAKAHDIPFYVAAPASTFDLEIAEGAGIPIEERSGLELASWRDYSPNVFNPVFDVTPNRLITALITEKGIIKPPFMENIKALL